MVGIRVFTFAVFVVGLATAAAAQSMDVVIIDRQSGETEYSYTVPQVSTTNGAAQARCSEFGYSANCAASGSSSTVTRPSQQYGYSVRGATLSLKLPDNRIAVVNCESKYALRMDHINRRSCYVPLVNQIRAEFKGDDAKLTWSVSIDGRKTQSETYKVIAVVNAEDAK
jgi:hypothetical protein